MEHRHEPRWFRNTCGCGHRITDDERREMLQRSFADLGRALRADPVFGRLRRLTEASVDRLNSLAKRMGL